MKCLIPMTRRVSSLVVVTVSAYSAVHLLLYYLIYNLAKRQVYAKPVSRNASSRHVHKRKQGWIGTVGYILRNKHDIAAEMDSQPSNLIQNTDIRTNRSSLDRFLDLAMNNDSFYVISTRR